MYYDKLPIIILSEMASSKSNAINGYIATYILGHLDEIKEDSIRELANRVNVSASSISRFCRDIGLKDYNELKALLNDTTLKFDICSYADTVPERKDDYVAAVQRCLEQVRTSIDMAKVRALCMDIRRYEQVAVFGVLKAEGVAMNLQTDLAMQG